MSMLTGYIQGEKKRINNVKPEIPPNGQYFWFLVSK